MRVSRGGRSGIKLEVGQVPSSPAQQRSTPDHGLHTQLSPLQYRREEGKDNTPFSTRSVS